MSLPTTIERFVKAGATLGELDGRDDGSRIVTYVAVSPYQPPEPSWLAEISFARLEARPAPDDVNYIQIPNAVRTLTMESRPAAVSYLEQEVEAFREAERREASKLNR